MRELTSSHWGTYRIVRQAGAAPRLEPIAEDPDPSPIGLSMLEGYRSRSRVLRPAVRRGWLEHGPGTRTDRRGTEPFVEVTWETALDLVAAELRRVVDAYGNGAIFGGSYGWASAGRFHHAQSQLKRFLNLAGGFVPHVQSYSYAAAQVPLPRIVAPMAALEVEHHDWQTLATHTRLFVTFGGAPHKNAQVSPGGAVQHRLRDGLLQLAQAGCRFVNFSPIRSDLDVPAGSCEWIPVRPNTDTAVMLALACETIVAGRHDRAFLGFAYREPLLVAMKRVEPPPGEARDDHLILAALAARLGIGGAFTEGRSTGDWIALLYEETRASAAADRIDLPPFRRFWDEGSARLPPAREPVVMLRAFRADPEGCRLATPSGRIEIHSDVIAGFGYAECPGHPVWLPPQEWLGAPLAATFPLHLISDQPRARLHSQLDCSPHSLQDKVCGREPLWIHPDDAARRNIADGVVVRVFNRRGQCLAGACVTDDVMPGVVKLSTGAWWDPLVPGTSGSLDKHGNPNVLTRDAGTSRLSQGCAAQSCLVEVEAFAGEPPPVTAFDPPMLYKTE